MAVTILGTSEGINSSAATNWTITTPSQMAVGTTTIIQCSSYSANGIGTPATDWEVNVEGQGALTGFANGAYQRSTGTYLSDLAVSNDNPSTSLTFTQASNPSVSRHAMAVTFNGGVITGSARLWKAGFTANTDSTMTGNVWRMGGCRTGDKLIFVMSSWLGTQDVSVITTGSTITLTNITKQVYYPGTTSGTPALSIWTADCGTTQAAGVNPVIGLHNPAGGATAMMCYVYAIRPHPPRDLGAGGNNFRGYVIGDSLTAGTNYYGALGGNTSGSSPERWIDRVFGSQATSVGATLNFTDAAVIGTDANPRKWYTGSYTPYDGSPTTAVNIRNMGQLGWDASTHYLSGVRANAIRNELDGTKGPDFCIISLGANDEKNLFTTTQFKNYLFGLAIMSGAKYIILVKQWAWAADFVTGVGTFTRVDTHANYLAAIDAVATLCTAAGLTPIVVSTASSASTSGGTNVPTVTATESYIGAVGGSGTVDNIHGTAASNNTTWKAAIQTALDQIPELNPASNTGILPLF